MAPPALIVDSGPQAWARFIEFFSARIRNRNTRTAYARAVFRFCRWCEKREVRRLSEVTPLHVAAHIEELTNQYAAPTTKQGLAAIRMLFDFLVTGQIVATNPAASVRGPTHVVKRGKTPALSGGEARQLLDSINVNTLSGLRDRALIATMIYSFARVSAVVAMNGEDYYCQGRRMWFRLHEKGGRRHDVPVHHKAEEYVDAYLAAAGISAEKQSALFRSLDRRQQLTARRLTRREVLAMVKRRSRAAGLAE